MSDVGCGMGNVGNDGRGLIGHAPAHPPCPIRHRPRRRRAGFTLIEGLLAGVILAAAAVAIAVGANLSIRSLRMAHSYQRSAELLDQVMARIDLLGPAAIVSQGPMQGQFEAPDEAFRWETHITELLEGSLYEISVRVIWQDGLEQHTTELHTRLNDPVGSRPIGLTWEEL